MTRILLYSDEPILAKGLESVLRQVEGFELLPTCGTVASLMEQMTHGAPDLVLMDLTPEITFAVLSDMKHAMVNSKIVLWVNSISTELAFQAMGLGVRGILRKTLPTDLQVKCLQKVQAGELWFEKALTDSFLCARRVALDAARRPTGEPAFPGIEEQGDRHHPHDLRRHREGLPVAPVPEGRREGPVRTGAVRPEEPDHRPAARGRKGTAAPAPCPVCAPWCWNGRRNASSRRPVSPPRCVPWHRAITRIARKFCEQGRPLPPLYLF